LRDVPLSTAGCRQWQRAYKRCEGCRQAKHAAPKPTHQRRASHAASARRRCVVTQARQRQNPVEVVGRRRSPTPAPHSSQRQQRARAAAGRMCCGNQQRRGELPNASVRQQASPHARPRRACRTKMGKVQQYGVARLAGGKCRDHRENIGNRTTGNVLRVQALP